MLKVKDSKRVEHTFVVGTVAMATVKDESFWGSPSFIEYFTLSVLGGRSQITNKTFAHTGGEHT